MKNYWSKRFILPTFLMFVLSVGAIKGTILWDSTMALDVVDQDLIIDGSVQLKLGANKIQSISTNIQVSVISNSQVRGNDGGPSQLYINAGAGRSINVFLGSFDLSFVGSIDVNTTPLLIVAEGPGEINFIIRGGRNLSFTKVTGSGGTQLYVLMSTSVLSTPILLFERDSSSASNLNVNITIGASSLMSFLSYMPVSAATDTGILAFDPSDLNPLGNFALNIEDTGGFVAAGALVTQLTPNPLTITLPNIDRTTAAGKNAIVQINNNIGATAHAGLFVLNKNAQLFDLLIDPFDNLGAALDGVGYKGSFSGDRLGFVLGSNATLQVSSNTYLDYVGLANNSCPDVAATVKERNGSAFFIDGNLNPLSVPAQINLAATSGIYFRSGVDTAGTINDLSSLNPFTVNPALQTPDAGAIVFDVEALVNVNGADVGELLQSKLEILSFQVNPTGGPLFMGGSQTTFPVRTFATECGLFLSYNKAAFLINNCLNLINTTLDHTDMNHNICEADDINSEPAYIGGEKFQLDCFVSRPKIAFSNAHFLVHTDVAFSGVDLRVANLVDSLFVCAGNLSNFVFFSNGKSVDNGTGRQFILGTVTGSRACDGFSSISADAHLDVATTCSCTNITTGILNELILTTSLNDDTINPCITTDITGQTSLHTIFLGNASNISIGSDSGNCLCADALNVVLSELVIGGNYFAFDTRGGLIGRPELGGVTGQGVIVVDNNGLFTIGSQFIATIDTMIIKRGNGQVILPVEQIYFGNRIGITDFQLDLSVTQTLVPAGAYISDYTINWRTVMKDFNNFCPYQVGSVNLCFCPPVVPMNVDALPTFVGEVNQLQIQGSRIGDPASVMINGGWVRELVFQDMGCPGEAATAVIVVEGEGRVGLNTAHRNKDSDCAQFVLGVNGIILIANGSGQVDLNDDVIINNHCPILRGPNFLAASGATAGDVFRINSDTPRELRVTKTGILDLRSFGEGDVLEFTGPLSVIFEAGAQLILGGMTIRWVDSACFICDPYVKSELIFASSALGPVDNTLSATTSTPASAPHNQFAPLTGLGQGLATTDSFRVKLIGVGTMEFAESSCFFIPKNTFVGVETLFKETLDVLPTVTCEIPLTNITVNLKDQAQFVIGDNDTNGGTFQIGNTISHTDHSVTFSLVIDGPDAQFINKSEGFIGLGVGIVDRRFADPNDWFVDNLFNVSAITLNLIDGLIQHDRIFDGSDLTTTDPDRPFSNASLLAIGNTAPAIAYSFILEPTPDGAASDRSTNANIKGGGNLTLITSSALSGQSGALSPIVTTQNDLVNTGSGVIAPRLRVGIMASREMLEDVDVVAGSASVLFDFLTVKEYFSETPSRGRAVVATGRASFETVRTPLRAGWIFGGAIGRDNMFDLADRLGGTMNDRRQRAAQLGAAGISLDFDVPAPAELAFAQQLG